MSVTSLGYVVIETTDPDRWHAFLTDTIGVMAAGEAEDGARLYRIDEREYRLRIEPSKRDRLSCSGFEISEADFDRFVDDARERGIALETASDADALRRGVAKLARATDPAGHDLEFYCGGRTAKTPFASPQGISAFVTGNLGLGHVVLAAPDFITSHDFYQALGFRDTDVPSFALAGPQEPETRFAFMHAGSGRHHSIALGELPVPPSQCIHVMLEVSSLDEVGKTYDRVREAGHKLSATLGKHMNDEMVGFYVQTPSGFDLEFGYDGMVIDPAEWRPTAHQQVSQWGHVWTWQAEMEQQQDQIAAAAGGQGKP